MSKMKMTSNLEWNKPSMLIQKKSSSSSNLQSLLSVMMLLKRAKSHNLSKNKSPPRVSELEDAEILTLFPRRIEECLAKLT